VKIVSIRTALVRLPVAEPLADGPKPKGATRDFITAVVQTDEGLEGLGIGFLFGGVLTEALKSALDELCGLVIGEDPLQHARIHQKLLTAASPAGPDGLPMVAVAAIDIALWDLKAKALGVSVATLAGGAAPRALTYASGALRRDYTEDELQRSADRLLKKGFRQMKMQLALPAPTSLEREVSMVSLVRQAVGADVDLMVDVNHNWSLRQALSIGPRLDPYDLYWLEDPIARDDYRGMAEVARSLATPVASGESVYGLTPFRHMVEAGSVDIVMVDVFRAGGITGWLRIAALAQAFNLPIVSHLAPEISVHLVCAVPNGLTVEFMPWSEGLYVQTPQPLEGWLQPLDGPGLGLAFDPDTLARYGLGHAVIR
jgi:L-talarate/galactarate dehydratase